MGLVARENESNRRWWERDGDTRKSVCVTPEGIESQRGNTTFQEASLSHGEKEQNEKLINFFSFSTGKKIRLKEAKKLDSLLNLEAVPCQHMAPEEERILWLSGPVMAVIRRVWWSESRAALETWGAGSKADTEVTVSLSRCYLFSGEREGKPCASLCRHLSSGSV